MSVFHTHTKLYHQSFKCFIVIHIQCIYVLFIIKIIASGTVEIPGGGNNVVAIKVISRFYKRCFATKTQPTLFKILFVISFYTVNINISGCNKIIYAGTVKYTHLIVIIIGLHLVALNSIQTPVSVYI